MLAAAAEELMFDEHFFKLMSIDSGQEEKKPKFMDLRTSNPKLSLKEKMVLPSSMNFVLEVERIDDDVLTDHEDRGSPYAPRHRVH